MNKNFILFGSVIVLLVFGFFVVNSYIYNEKQAEDWPKYENLTYEFSVEYPESKTPVENIQEDFFVVNFFDKLEYDELMNSEAPREGPISISVMVFPNSNPENLTDWVTTNPYSNYQLLTDEVKEINFAEHDALSYSTTGLYEAKNIVVKHEGSIYLVSVTYHSLEDEILQEFNRFVDSFWFDMSS